MHSNPLLFDFDFQVNSLCIALLSVSGDSQAFYQSFPKTTKQEVTRNVKVALQYEVLMLQSVALCICLNTTTSTAECAIRGDQHLISF